MNLLIQTGSFGLKRRSFGDSDSFNLRTSPVVTSESSIPNLLPSGLVLLSDSGKSRGKKPTPPDNGCHATKEWPFAQFVLAVWTFTRFRQREVCRNYRQAAYGQALSAGYPPPALRLVSYPGDSGQWGSRKTKANLREMKKSQCSWDESVLGIGKQSSSTNSTVQTELVGDDMNINYLVSQRTNGANPFKIFEACKSVPQPELKSRLRKLPYSDFTRTAYWFGVSHVAKASAKMKCQVCNSPSGIQTHHRTYETHGEEHLNMHDLVVLCELCHGLFHGHLPPQFKAEPHKKPRAPLSFDGLDLVSPPPDPIHLTRDTINLCRTSAGGFTNATLNALGIPNEETFVSGWLHRQGHRIVTAEQFTEAQKGRFVYRSKRQ